jgi:hypothetical protein
MFVYRVLSCRLLSRNIKVKIRNTIILPTVLYGCKTWSFTLREEHRLRVFENRVLRRVFGPKREEVTGEWRKLTNGELRNFYSSSNIIRQIKSRKMRWAGHVARMREEEKSTGFWWESPRQRDHLGDRGVDGRMGLEWKIGWEDVA